MNSQTNRRRFLKQSTLTAGLLSGSPLISVGAGSDKIRMGQIGVAHGHAAGKIRSYRQSTEFEVVGIHEPDLNRWNQVKNSQDYRGVKWMTLEELLNTKRLQAVAVETEVKDLLKYAESCVAVGMHIHLDKAPGDSLSRFRGILERSARQNRVVQMGYMYRYNPAIEMLRDLLEKGWLGDPFEVHTVMSKVVAPNARKDLAEYPGGIMYELGCHLIDLVVGLMGKPDQVHAYPKTTGKSDDGLIDNMLAVFEYPGATATVKSSAVEVEGFARRHFVLCGTEGTFHIQPLDSPKASLALSRAHGGFRKGYQEIEFPRFTRYIADASDFAKIIRGEKSTDYPPSHDLAVQEAVLKACALPVQ
ncbi:MAG TPA: Gfo/Idh/MocA family oxidoreductase [Verrucomicrobiales bacterium]|nr:Gfo/Idh/MocA family oxidoreductase [Verrucomicrobiales bacterium]